MIRRTKHIVCVFGAMIVAVTSLHSEASASSRPTVEYRLGAGDIVRVRVFGQEEISGKYELDGDGTISMSLIGPVELNGRTVKGAEHAIVQKLKPDYLKNPYVSVQVTNYRPFYILGEVQKPGSYPYSSGINVMEAVALAGGYTYRADKDDIEITRPDEQWQSRDVEPDATVMPDDTIRVGERFF